MEDTVIAPELDYKKKNYSYPVYKHSRILPQAGTQTVAVSNSGGAESLFEIPTKVFNLSQSYLSFIVNPGQLATKQNWMAADVFGYIRQIQLYTRGGLFLADIQNFDNYTKAVWKTDIKLEDFLTFDKTNSGGATTAALVSGFGQGIRPNNAAAATGTFGARYNNTAASVSFLEPQYVYTGSAVNTANPFLSFKLNLDLIKNTIFSINKDLFFDEVVVMRVIWNGPGKYVWGADVGANPAANPVAFTTDGATINNLTLFVAIETNQDIVQQIMAKKNSGEGISLLVPYVYGNKIGLTGDSQSVSLKYSRAHGIKLLKIYHQLNSQVENSNTAYDTSNIADARVSSFYTLLNNNRLQEFDVTCANGDDWMLMREKLKGSLMLDSNVYKYNFVWIDDFSDYDAPIDRNESKDDNLIRGIDLSSEQKWDFYMNKATAPANNHYTFAVTLKMLIVNSNGIQLM